MGLLNLPVLIMLLQLSSVKNEERVGVYWARYPNKDCLRANFKFILLDQYPRQIRIIIIFFLLLMPRLAVSREVYISWRCVRKLKFQQSIIGKSSRVITGRGAVFTYKIVKITALRRKISTYSQLPASREETDKLKEYIRYWIWYWYYQTLHWRSGKMAEICRGYPVYFQ